MSTDHSDELMDADTSGGAHIQGDIDTRGGDFIGRDKIDADVFVAGDNAAYAAIGEGAKIIHQQVYFQIAGPLTEDLNEEARLSRRRLTESITGLVARYEVLASQTIRERQTNPYKSLLDYRIEDGPHFYGRESEIKALLEMLQDSSRFTILYADSGVGKSSLLQAGLAARLIANGRLPIIVRLRPDMPQPIDAIKEAIIPDFNRLPELRRLRRISLRGLLIEASRCLGGAPLYIFVDQFEEFFLELQTEQQLTFASQLADCLQEPGLEVSWLISLKTDQFSELALFESHGIRPFENKYHLRPLQSDEARAVITAPASAFGVQYEEGLVDRILNDLSQDCAEIYPPEVQLICYTLFEEMRNANQKNLITQALYDRERGESGGGAPGILRGHLSQVLQRISNQEQEVAMTILRSLVTSGHRRAVRTKSDLIQEISQTQTAVQPPLLESVLIVLQRNRLLRTTKESAGVDEVRYEITHDYLLKDVEIDALLTRRKKAYEMLQQGIQDWVDHRIISLSEQALRIIDEEINPSTLSSEALDFLSRVRAHYERRVERVLFTVLGGTVGGPVALFLLFLLDFLLPNLGDYFPPEAIFGTGLVVGLAGGMIGFGISIGKLVNRSRALESVLGGSLASSLIIALIFSLLTANSEINQNPWIVILPSAIFGGGIAVSVRLGARSPAWLRILLITISGLVVGTVVVLFGFYTGSILFTWLFAFGGAGIALGIGLAEQYLIRKRGSRIFQSKQAG